MRDGARLLAHTGYRAWTAEEDTRVREMWDSGAPAVAIAEELGRSRNAVRLRHNRLVPFDYESYTPGWGKSPGRRTYWTPERVMEGLRLFAARHKGMLPNSDHEYSRLKKGHMEYPTAVSVLRLHGTMADAWEAMGAGRQRVTRGWVPWSQTDDDYLLDHAGLQTLKVIAKHLGRGWAACKRRLYDLGAGRARDVSGHLSAMQVARLYDCPLSRVKQLIASGELKAHRVQGGNYWRIDPGACERIQAKLSAPKRKSYRTTPANHGDYDRRYGLMRVRIDGKVVRVPRPASAARKEQDGTHVPATKFHPYESRYPGEMEGRHARERID